MDDAWEGEGLRVNKRTKTDAISLLSCGALFLRGFD